MKLQKLNIIIEGNEIPGFALKTSESLWVHVQNRTFSIPLKKQKSKHGGGSHVDTGDGSIRAPMPGKIIKISVKDGESVQEGQTVIVMEAMKMEYALKAPWNGLVKIGKQKPGDQVPLGELLATVEKKS